MAAGGVHIAPRPRLELHEGRLADMAASDLELGYAGAKVYAGFHEGAAFVVSLFSVERPELIQALGDETVEDTRRELESARTS